MTAPAGAARAGDAWEASVALCGGLVLAAALRWQVLEPSDVSWASLDLWPCWLLALAVIAAELRPLRLPGREGERLVSVSAAAAVALALVGPVLLALAALALPVLIDDLRRGARLRALFAAGQCILGLAAARAVFSMLTGSTFFAAQTPVEGGDVAVALLAAVTFILVTTFTAIFAVALRAGLSPVLVAIEAGRDAGPGLVLAAAAPVVAALATTAPATLPVLAAALVAVHLGAARLSRNASLDSHDPLTGLPNSAALDRELELATTVDDRVGLLLLELPQLAEINDTLGHAAGDALLLEAAGRMASAVPAELPLARRGAGFAVVLPGADLAATKKLAARLAAAMDAPFAGPGEQHLVRVGIGIAVAPDHATGPGELIRAADVARHRAGRIRPSIAVYGTETGRQVALRRSLADDLHRGLDDEEFELLFQPQVDRDGNVATVEGLLRWRHPEHGLLEPRVFVPLAEHTGMIERLSRRALESALVTLGLLRASGHDLGLSLNLSARSLGDPELQRRITRSLLVASLPATRLTVEVPESALTSDPVGAIAALHELRETGIRIAVDDYGTGWSPVSALQRLQPDELKVDRSYVLTSALDVESADVVRSAVGLAHELGLATVAVGVEDQGTLDTVTSLGCDRVQGFHIAPPMLPAALKAWLDTAAVHGGHSPAVPRPAVPGQLLRG